MLGDVLAHALRRRPCDPRPMRASRNAVTASSGNLASITSGRCVGQEDDAVRPRLVRQRVLEFVDALGQAVLDDRLHPRLAESAARLLVGEHVAQRGHLCRQIGDVLLRAVDDGEPLMQALQPVDGLLGGRIAATGRAAPTRRRAARTAPGRAPPGGPPAPRPWPAGGRRSRPAACDASSASCAAIAAARRGARGSASARDARREAASAASAMATQRLADGDVPM